MAEMYGQTDVSLPKLLCSAEYKEEVVFVP